MPKNTATCKTNPVAKAAEGYKYRKTAKLFDLMFKSIIKDASSSAVVHLINGIYKRNYPLNSKVIVEPTEFVKENPKSGKMEKIISDIIITLHHDNRTDMFLMEAQIDDDAEMILRIFNYSIAAAYEKRNVSEDGSFMEINIPSPIVIYWETSNAKDIVSVKIRFPNDENIVYEVPTFKVLNHSVSELEGMALLLPFYILKIRSKLNKKGVDSEDRKELATELEKIIIDIDEVFKKCKQNNYITNIDTAMLLRRLSRMYKELYGGHKEFMEVDMTLEKLVEVDVYEAVDKAVAKAEKRVQRRCNLQTAKSMIMEGFDSAVISRITKLPEKQISALM